MQPAARRAIWSRSLGVKLFGAKFDEPSFTTRVFGTLRGISAAAGYERFRETQLAGHCAAQRAAALGAPIAEAARAHPPAARSAAHMARAGAGHATQPAGALPRQ